MQLSYWAQVAFAARCAKRVQHLTDFSWCENPGRVRSLVERAVWTSEHGAATKNGAWPVLQTNTDSDLNAMVAAMNQAAQDFISAASALARDTKRLAMLARARAPTLMTMHSIESATSAVLAACAVRIHWIVKSDTDRLEKDERKPWEKDERKPWEIDDPPMFEADDDSWPDDELSGHVVSAAIHAADAAQAGGFPEEFSLDVWHDFRSLSEAHGGGRHYAGNPVPANFFIPISRNVAASEYCRTKPAFGILHISDLHFRAEDDPAAHLQPLLADLRSAYFKDVSIDVIVLSGDLADKGSPEGLDKAAQFIDGMLEQLDIATDHCLIVPGNHDIQDRDDSYLHKSSKRGLPADAIVQRGEVVLRRDDSRYANRFESFCQKIVVPRFGDPVWTTQHWTTRYFPEVGVQFILFNSAWQIDQYHRERASISNSAIAAAMRKADSELADHEDWKRVLRIGVWHHSVAGAGRLGNADFLDLLAASGVRFCLHGDVHEMRCELAHYKRGKGTEIKVVGAGSLGAGADLRPESTPRLYNLISIASDLKSARVHTRQRPSSSGAWKGWYEWPHPNSEGAVSYFNLELVPWSR